MEIRLLTFSDAGMMDDKNFPTDCLTLLPADAPLIFLNKLNKMFYFISIRKIFLYFLEWRLLASFFP